MTKLKNTMVMAKQDHRILLPEPGLRDEGVNKNSKLADHNRRDGRHAN